MKLLLDTHVVLWALGSPERLTPAARKVLQEPEHVIFASAVSAWEIEIKRAIGKLDAPDDLLEQLALLRFSELPLRLTHVRALSRLPAHHPDPFDRMLVAQAAAEDLVFVTRDRRMRSYPIRCLAA